MMSKFFCEVTRYKRGPSVFCNAFFTTRSVTYTGQLFWYKINCLLFVLTEFVLSGTQCNPWNLETTGPFTPSQSKKYQRTSGKSQRKFSLLFPFSLGMILDNKRCCELGVNDRISFVEKSTVNKCQNILVPNRRANLHCTSGGGTST